MENWESMLMRAPIHWLLEKENPSVRYFALKDLLDKDEEDQELRRARKNIMRTGLVPGMLQKQKESAYVAAYPRFYSYKYKGLVWALLVFAELGAQTSTEIKAQCEYLFENAQDKQEGGFSQNSAKKQGGGRRTEVIPCLTGNMVWAMIRFGYLDDLRLQAAIEWMNRFMRFNDGTLVDPQAPPYDRYEICWGAHTCFMGVVKVLKALSAIPMERRSKRTQETIDKGTEFMLVHHLYKRSHQLRRVSKPGWLKFAFPLMYQTDLLEILDILTRLGFKDPRMEEAVQVLLSKQDPSGRWHAENAYLSERLLLPMTEKAYLDKWITLRALCVLKRYIQ